MRLDVLQEIDGPMLQHGLQGFQGRRIHVPRADHLKPDRDFLAERYTLVHRASRAALSLPARVPAGPRIFLADAVHPTRLLPTT